MWLVRTRFRRTTAAGRKAAARAALQARFLQAAVTIQKYVRRHLAKKKVGIAQLYLKQERPDGYCRAWLPALLGFFHKRMQNRLEIETVRQVWCILSLLL